MAQHALFKTSESLVKVISIVMGRKPLVRFFEFYWSKILQSSGSNSCSISCSVQRL